jgi:hypothetical protein
LKTAPFIRFYFLITLLVLPFLARAQKVAIYFDSNVSQIKFAAEEIKLALEAEKFTVEMLSLSQINSSNTNSKVVLALANTTKITDILVKQNVKLPITLGEQAYCLRTTSKPTKTYWVLGGDANGAMYGGLQMAENIKFNKLKGDYNSQETPAILKRGIKLNFPLDIECPTYGKTNMGGFEGTSYKEAIPHVWDMNFWTEWFDEMARNRYNTVSVWNCHPFSAMIKMEDYPDVAIEDVKGFNGFSKKMTIDEKIDFWRKVMAYAHSRGFDFLLFNWNVFTYGASGKYGITDKADNPATIEYMRKAMVKLLETYPDLDGFGVTNGENKSTQDFLWETYGKGMYEYALAHPERKIRFIHRWHWANLPSIKKGFNPLFTLPNVTFDMSYKYSVAHMYSVAVPKWMESDKADQALRESKLKTWLTVRNDEMYYHNWGDPNFARTYVKGMMGIGKDIFTGFYMGSDGYCPTRDFLSKNPVSKGILEVKRQWYMNMLWGRLSYNPNTSDDVFKNYMKLRYPSVSSNTLFEAWTAVSRAIPKITELVQGSWKIDLNWWLEGCIGIGNNGYRTNEAFAKCKVADGSELCSISKSAADSCFVKKSSYQLADEIEKEAKLALSLTENMKADSNTELGLAKNNIQAMSYMTLFYANKIRAATFQKAKNTEKAKNAMGEAYLFWISYSKLMSEMYNGMDMQRVRNFPKWDGNNDSVLKEYHDLGGSGIPVSSIK